LDITILMANGCKTMALETVFGLAPKRVENRLVRYLKRPKSLVGRRRST
jgi:hypothetical protein